MSIPKYASRRDDNELPIIDALEAAGWGVLQLNATGVPDLLVGRGKRLYLLEIIGEEKAKKYRHSGGLTPDQVHFHSRWPGEIHLVKTPEAALAIVRRKP